jgi:hypothetical protein
MRYSILTNDHGRSPVTNTYFTVIYANKSFVQLWKGPIKFIGPGERNCRETVEWIHMEQLWPPRLLRQREGWGA